MDPVMTCIHGDKVNKLSECSLLHDIINNPKLTKYLNIHYYPIIYVRMNTQKGRVKFKKFQILLNSGFNYTIVTGRIKKIKPKEDAVMQLHTKVGKITTNLKVNIDFNLPELRATKIVTWNCNVDDSYKGRYDVILGRYLLSVLGLNLKFSYNVIEVD